jgi:acetyltransferase-like isoleucine patch superfamily enzyme
MPSLLTVPYLGSAEDEVRLAAWLVEPGAAFAKGQSLAVVETLKAAFEIEAPAAGTLVSVLVSPGERAAVHAPLAVLAAPGEQPQQSAIEALLAAHAPPEPASRTAPESIEPAPAQAAPAARHRARELGVSLTTIDGTGPGGLIRVEDVERAARGGEGRIDPAFLAQLRADRAAFAQLASAFKIDLYRRAGARIEGDVAIGRGAVLCAERLVLGTGTRIGEGCSIDAAEFVAGRLVQLGARCSVRARRVALGDNAFFATDIEVGGGGAFDPEAELIVGSHGFVGEHAHLNPCRRLQIGDEVVVSRGAVLMTHSFGGSVLDGMPNRFAGVTIGDRCQIGIGAVLFPGVNMGAGSILLSGSSLVTDVPAGRLFGGVPARDLKAAAGPLSRDERREVGRGLIEEFARQLALRGRDVQIDRAADTLTATVRADGGEHRLRWLPTPPAAETALPREDVIVCPEIGDAEFAGIGAEITAIDLGAPRIRGPGGPLADALREFLRKRGVRLRPRTWTYPGGWL